MALSESCNSTLPDCLSPTIRDPWERDYAAIVPRFSGSLSVVSSATIIYVILRSAKGLSGIYHRIMFGMSIADILGSSAMALTSLPMPSYMPKEMEFGYHWAGTRLGNTYTCNAQGFFASFGACAMFFYTATLCIFYACSIAFNMRERNIGKYVEPIIHGLPVLVGLLYAIPPLILDMYNPGITSYAWCAPLPYPDECLHQDIQCVRGSADAMNFIMMLLRCLIISVFLVVVVSMVLIVGRVTSTERMLRKVALAVYAKADNCTNLEGGLRRHSFTKAVVFQASAYIFALLLGLLLPLFRTMSIVSATESEKDWGKIVAMDKGILVLLPVQGFFNLVIFISHKIYNYRRASNSSISTCGILRLLFLQAGTHEPVYISKISIVKKEFGDDDDGNVDQKSKRDCYEFDVVEDDNEQEVLQFRISLFQQQTQLQVVEDSSIVQSDTQNGSAIQQPSVVTDSAIDLDPNEQLCIASPGLSSKTSISFGGHVADCDVDISYDDLNHSRSFGLMSFTSGGDEEEKPQRKYYYISKPY